MYLLSQYGIEQSPTLSLHTLTGCIPENQAKSHQEGSSEGIGFRSGASEVGDWDSFNQSQFFLLGPSLLYQAMEMCIDVAGSRATSRHYSELFPLRIYSPADKLRCKLHLNLKLGPFVTIRNAQTLFGIAIRIYYCRCCFMVCYQMLFSCSAR